MTGRSQSDARSDLEAEARLLLDRLKRALMLARHTRLALVQSEATGNYRYLDTAVAAPSGLLGWCDAETTLEQLKAYMVGEPRRPQTQRASAGRSP